MRRFSCISALLVGLTIAVPAPAGAAEVGSQVERTNPAKFPEDLPGCAPRRCVRGGTIPRGWVLLSRRVTLDAGERRAGMTFRCPGGRRFLTFGFLERDDLIIQIPRSQFPYRNRSRIRVLAERSIAPVNRRASGTLYAVCRPR